LPLSDALNESHKRQDQDRLILPNAQVFEHIAGLKDAANHEFDSEKDIARLLDWLGRSRFQANPELARLSRTEQAGAFSAA
jgi:hypothetical protein